MRCPLREKKAKFVTADGQVPWVKVKLKRVRSNRLKVTLKLKRAEIEAVACSEDPLAARLTSSLLLMDPSGPPTRLSWQADCYAATSHSNKSSCFRPSARRPSRISLGTLVGRRQAVVGWNG